MATPSALNVKAEPRRALSLMRGAVGDEVWAGIRGEFTLPSLEQVRGRLEELTSDPEPMMRQLVRVFIGDGTYCPGFQFLPGGTLHQAVITLFDRALELDVGHNYFSAWMVTPTRYLEGNRPVHLLHEKVRVMEALEASVR